MGDPDRAALEARVRELEAAAERVRQACKVEYDGYGEKWVRVGTVLGALRRRPSPKSSR